MAQVEKIAICVETQMYVHGDIGGRHTLQFWDETESELEDDDRGTTGDTIWLLIDDGESDDYGHRHMIFLIMDEDFTATYDRHGLSYPDIEHLNLQEGKQVMRIGSGAIEDTILETQRV